MLCQHNPQGANRFRLSGYKSSNTKKISDFVPHKVVMMRARARVEIIDHSRRQLFLVPARQSVSPADEEPKRFFEGRNGVEAGPSFFKRSGDREVHCTRF
jgi:hypothetical protein